MVTITDNDPLPTLSISNAGVSEGAASSSGTAMTFTVTLSAVSGQTVTVNYATADSTATAGGSNANGGQDYTSTSGALSFAPGEVTRTVTVAVLGDPLNEADEILFVDLSAPVAATVLDGRGDGAVMNDDPIPTISIGDVTQNEGTGGPTQFQFAVSLSAASGRPVTVGYATQDGSATSATTGGGPDYVELNNRTLTFAAGATASSITISVVGDPYIEQTESFVVNLTMPTNATLLDNQGTGTIVNDGP